MERELVGLVERGLITLERLMLIVVRLGRVVVMQLVRLNFIVEISVRVHPVMMLLAAWKEESARLGEF